jgi:hypothetical protein
MADTSAKKKVAAKPKKPAAHPPYDVHEYLVFQKI